MDTDRTRSRHVVLVADIGGTFARFALARDGVLLNEPVRLERATFADLPAACLQYLAELGVPSIDGTAVAAAGQLHDGRIEMTNADWAIDSGELEARLQLPSGNAIVLNDFGALAWALPSLAADELEPIGPLREGSGNRVIVGPGTGLGVAAAIRTAGGWHPLATEGGHASYAPETAFERAAGELAAGRFGRVSWERLLSGPGLELLHEAAAMHLGLEPVAASAPDVLDACRRGDSPCADLAVDTFIALMGSFAGDLALLFDAGGGIVIAGGVLPRIAEVRSFDGLRERFESKGRFSHWLEQVPVSLLQSPFAALRGAAIAYRR
jgi:glucokinase